MKPISEKTCERSWLAAAEHLVHADDHREYNLMVETHEPTIHEPSDHAIRGVVNRFLRHYDANPVSTVAGTIFPAAEYRDHGRRGVFEIYPEQVYPEIKGPTEWGRYAYRLVRWPGRGADAAPIRPLEYLIDKMKKQLAGSRMRACYELSLSDSAIDLPLYDPVTDRKLPRNGPCLSHISLKIGDENRLYLTALYRSHSYVARALGNFLGLAALQAFVCDETGLVPGPLVSVSTYARLETDDGWPVSAAIQMIADARAAFQEGKPDEAT